MGTVKSHVLIGAFFLVYAACEGTAYAEAAAADPAINAGHLWEALVEGDPELNLRFRTEHVESGRAGRCICNQLAYNACVSYEATVRFLPKSRMFG